MIYFYLFSGLRQVVITNNHRSATVSPSSENSPSQDMQSEEGSYANHGGGFNQYSSQDSLPDSPYSSQSLDSQPAPGQGIYLPILLHIDTPSIKYGTTYYLVLCFFSYVK